MTKALVCMAMFVALVPGYATGQNVTDLQAVLRRVDLLEATQLRILRELESISTRRVSPPPPVIPSVVQSISDAAVNGSDDAAVVLIEYADFQCPYCGQFARQVLPEIHKRYVATGKLRLVFRHMPLREIHPQAVMAAESAECARQQGRFWQMHDALFSDQHLDEASLMEKARANGVGLEQFSECVRGDGTVKVKQDLAAARALGLAVTPTFLIGRDVGGAVRVEQILTGVRDVDVFIGAIESVLNDRASQ